MATTIIGIGIGIIITTLAIEPHVFAQYGCSILPMLALAGTLIGIVVFTL